MLYQTVFNRIITDNCVKYAPDFASGLAAIYLLDLFITPKKITIGYITDLLKTVNETEREEKISYLCSAEAMMRIADMCKKFNLGTAQTELITIAFQGDLKLLETKFNSYVKKLFI